MAGVLAGRPALFRQSLSPGSSLAEQPGLSNLVECLHEALAFDGHFPFNRAVLAVPAALWSHERAAIRRAAQAAGVEAVRIISAPAAAALALTAGREPKSGTVLVVHFGADTHALGVVNIDEGVVEVVATAGCQRGEEEAIDVERLIGRVLADSGVEPGRIDEAVLLGGTVREPVVAQLIQRAAPNARTIRPANSGELVALGAAIQAGILSGEITDLMLLDATSRTLSIEIAGGRLTPLIHCHTTIPVRRTLTFAAADPNARMIHVRVFEGNTPTAAENRPVGGLLIQRSPSSGLIEVTLDIDANEAVRLTVVDCASGAQASALCNDYGDYVQPRGSTLLVPIEPCLSCGALPEVGDRFCAACGKPLG